MTQASEHHPQMRLTDIRHSYDGQDVVKGVSLDLQAGSVTCLLGPSGCGKSTTLKIAAGVERQVSGSVEIEGKTISDDRIHAPPETRSVGLMFQDFALFPHLSVAQNISFGLSKRDDARVANLLNRVDLAGFEDKFPHQLSGGEAQRVALARALAPRPAILLMDEPFSGLDNRLRDEIRDQTLNILKEENAAVLLVTHEPDEAMRMADQIALMRDGQIVQTGAPFNIYNTPMDKNAAAFFSDINVIHGIVKHAQTETPFGQFFTPGLRDETDVEIIIRPQHLKLDFDRDGTGPNPTIADGVAARGHVKRARFMGNQSIVELAMDHDNSTLTATVPAVFLPKEGTPLWLSLRRDRCYVFPCSAQSKVENPYLSGDLAG